MLVTLVFSDETKRFPEVGGDLNQNMILAAGVPKFDFARKVEREENSLIVLRLHCMDWHGISVPCL